MEKLIQEASDDNRQYSQYDFKSIKIGQELLITGTDDERRRAQLALAAFNFNNKHLPKLASMTRINDDDEKVLVVFHKK